MGVGRRPRHVGAALRAAGAALAGTAYDVPLTPVARAGTAWLAEFRVREALPAWLRRAGLTPAEANRAQAHLRSDPAYRGARRSPRAPGSSATGARIYRLATRCGALGG